jgi:hypothetical protein
MGYDEMMEYLNSDRYRNKIPFPKRTEHSPEEFKRLYKEYQTEGGRLEALFRQDLFDTYGVNDNPKKDLCFTKAWSRGHSSGYYEVLTIWDDLVELIL